uniref:DUF2339 domain-containing protein n=1 Tax=Flavobacterium sp. TaxID=239 RepID=UPI00404A2692
MTDKNDRINQLFEKLNTLMRKYDRYSKEIYELREEIHNLKTSIENEKLEASLETKKEPQPEEQFESETEIPATVEPIFQTKQAEQPQDLIDSSFPKSAIKTDIEKFIGENLINKIGIAITIIGVAIGAKYSIENQLISPLTRIILGYLMGLGLLGFGIKLKKNYHNYSAVLVSGSIAILYFITFAAHSFYDLIPQVFAFALMVVFTAFTVVAAISYNKQVIALIGLVGAYAVPFMLSDGSGNVAILFSYIAIINIGILIIAFKKYWKSLYYSSFVLTWLIFTSWYFLNFQTTEHFGLSLTFAAIFFLIFYSIFLAYKLLQKEKFASNDILLLLGNSFIFYSLGYAILSSNTMGNQLLGIFTLANAAIHFIVSVVIFRLKLADRNLFFLIAGLVLVFITIAIPVQLDGNWVTLLWVFEAALLFWIGRTKNVPVYEKLSFPLMFLAFFSLTQDYLTFYDNYNPNQPETKIIPLFNVNFLSSLMFIGSFVFINYLNNKKEYISSLTSKIGLHGIIKFSMPAILLIVLYYSFRLEISSFWNQKFLDSALAVTNQNDDLTNVMRNYDLNKFKIIWIINYSLLFGAILSFVNSIKLKNRQLGYINLIFNSIVLFAFLVQSLYVLSELRESYLNQTHADLFQRNSFHLGIRYISFAFVGFLLVSIYQYSKQDFLKPTIINLKISFDFLLYFSLIWIASSELIHWLEIINFSQSYKLGLSILWGVYALLLISLGIWKNKKHLRVGAIGLFSVTLIKLFFYDISHLDTIAKTIVFVSLGILLLIISFLYNKFKHLIYEEHEN